MNRKPLYFIPNEILRTKCRVVQKVDSDIKRICSELEETMFANNGIGLAAPQIGYDLRIFTTCVGDDSDGNPFIGPCKIFINPKILKFSDDSVVMREGCLSIPNFVEVVERPRKITVEAMDISGKSFLEEDLSGWYSRCIQHEMDHLDGILFIDRLSDELKEKHSEQIKSMMINGYKSSGKIF